MYSHCRGSSPLTGDKALRLCSSGGPRAPVAARGESGGLLDVVVVHGFPGCVTVMQEEYGHSAKHSHSALSALRDLFPDGLHADVSRQLAFPSRGVDSG